MARTSRGILIVGAEGIEDAEGATRRVARISGVVEAEYNSVTRKLHVKYEGDAATLRKIELEVKETLDGLRGGEQGR